MLFRSALHIPSYTLCQCQDTRIPLQPGICSHNQGKKAAWRVHRIHGEAGAPPHRGFAHSSSPRGRGQPGERCALRSSGKLWSRCRALGSVPLEKEQQWYLLRKAFTILLLTCFLGSLLCINPLFGKTVGF